MLCPPDSIMFTPLKLALDTILPIWSRSVSKSALMEARLLESSEVSEADRALAFIWFSRSEIWLPAVTATSTVDCPRCSEEVTESSAAICERWVWAMAQVAPSSLALATFRPVLIWFCASVSWDSVLLRFCSAINASALVLMLKEDITRGSLFEGNQRHFDCRWRFAAARVGEIRQQTV